MSKPINSGFPFPGMESSEELDINAIFGGSAPANDINPFDTPTEQSEGPAREPTNPISAAIDKQETQTAKRRPGLCLKSSPFSPMAAPRMRSPMEP